MEEIVKKIVNNLNDISEEERHTLLTVLRDEIDVVDKTLVELLCKRTLFAVLIGRLKRSMDLPTYNPEREKDIAVKISSYVEEPLSKDAVLRIYERIIDESRAVQKEEIQKGNIFKIKL